MKKQYEDRLDELERRVSEHDSLDGERDKLRAAVTDINLTVDRRITQLHDQLRQQTTDRCLQLEKVCQTDLSKSKVIPYSLPSIGPGTDLGVQVG